MYIFIRNIQVQFISTLKHWYLHLLCRVMLIISTYLLSSVVYVFRISFIAIKQLSCVESRYNYYLSNDYM
jgi:hypothetical protein